MFASLIFAAALLGPPHVVVPRENVTEGKLPSMESAEAMAKELLVAIQADDAASVSQYFFPKAEFTRLKDIPRPWEYHAKLMGWYVDDVSKKHREVKDAGALTYEGFKPGGCKWKAKGTEANRIAYWSCWKAKILARDATNKAVSIEIRAMINWGTTWYVTHLGPIP